MTEWLNEERYRELVETVKNHLGEAIVNIKKKDILKKIETVTEELKLNSPEDLVRGILMGEMSWLNQLTTHLTIGESYFFRHHESLKIVVDEILPELIPIARQEKRDINIWSAACANGEEPYSLAIMTERLLLPPGIKLNIYASDINTAFLKNARAGIYTKWAFRELPETLQKQYFSQDSNNHYEIIDAVKKRVVFFNYNLLKPDACPLPVNCFDLILCRNVLIYFNNTQINQALQLFNRCLHEKGWLLTSPAEVGTVPKTFFSSTCLNGSYFFRHTNAEVKKNTSPYQFNQLPINHSGKVKKALPVKKRPINPLTTSSTVAPQQSKEPDITPITPVEELLSKASARQQEFFAEEAAAIARACADRGRMDDARYWSDYALRRDKFNTSYYLLHAQICQESGDLPAAHKAYIQALYLDQDNIAAYFYLGMLCLNTDDLTCAKRNLKNAEKLLVKLAETDEPEHCAGLTAGMMLKAIRDILNGNKLKVRK